MDHEKILVEKIFGKFTKDTLTELLDAIKEKYKKSEKRDNLASLVAKACQTKGEQNFITALEQNKETLKRLLEEYGCEIKSNGKTALKAELKKIIEDKSINSLISKAKAETLRSVCTALEFETEDDVPKNELVDDINEEVIISGARAILNKLKSTEIKELCKTLEVRHTATKTKSIDIMLHEAFPALEVEEEKAEKGKASEELKANRKPIESGITADDLLQQYFIDELRQYCKDNGLTVGGKKSLIIKRIMSFLAGDRTTTVKGYKLEKRKEKAEEKKKRKAEKEKQKKENPKKAKQSQNNKLEEKEESVKKSEDKKGKK